MKKQRRRKKYRIREYSFLWWVSRIFCVAMTVVGVAMLYTIMWGISYDMGVCGW